MTGEAELEACELCPRYNILIDVLQDQQRRGAGSGGFFQVNGCLSH